MRLIKNSGTALFDYPALAEGYEFAKDGTSATFRLRDGVLFHNSEPVTSEDIKFSYQNYRGAHAATFKAKTEAVDIVDMRTVRFRFKEPFLDFLLLFGSSNVTGAGWVVPAKYYQQVGPDGFMRKPIGAGPFQAHLDRDRREIAVRGLRPLLPACPRQEPDHALGAGGRDPACHAGTWRGGHNLRPIRRAADRVKKNSKLMLAPVLSGSFWLEFVGFQDPNNPFHDKRVRQAMSLAMDRTRSMRRKRPGSAKSAVTGSTTMFSTAWSGPSLSSIWRRPGPLMREAGHPNGFTVDWLTPLAPFYSRGEAWWRNCRRSASAPSCRSWNAASSCSAPGRQTAMAGHADHHARGSHRWDMGQLV